MPIKSYLAYPVRGRSDELAATFRRLDHRASRPTPDDTKPA